MGRKDNKSGTNKSALETAYGYLASRMRTVQETRKHLKDKGYDAAEIDETIADLRKLSYLDDYQYALRYYEYNREKHRGSLRAMRELQEKGVDADTAENAREDFLYENKVDEFMDALEVSLKTMALSMPDNGQAGDGDEAVTFGGMLAADDRLAAKLARKLETRGFARGDIFRVLDRIRQMDYGVNGEEETGQ